MKTSTQTYPFLFTSNIDQKSVHEFVAGNKQHHKLPSIDWGLAHTTATCFKELSTESVRQQALFTTFQAWALKNYGESGKTITVTKSKYEKVVNVLKGLENNVGENSKLKFWIKSKGFQLGRGSVEFEDAEKDVLFIPTKVNHNAVVIF